MVRHMRESKFRSLKQLKDESLFNKKLQVGDHFLYGQNVIDQINTKKVGDQVTYYKVINKTKGRNIEYQMVFDVLEQNKKLEEND